MTVVLTATLDVTLSALFNLASLRTKFTPSLHSVTMFTVLKTARLVYGVVEGATPSPVLVVLFSTNLKVLF